MEQSNDEETAIEQSRNEEMRNCNRYHLGTVNNLGPVVQSVVSLMSSLRVISLTVLADSIYNILIFFAEKVTFFQQKISAYLRITRYKF